MTYPQQPSDPQYPQQPPQYQQPMYPPPLTMQPAPPAGTSIDFSAINRPENRPYLIAGVGGLVALLAFLILPFYAVSYNIVGLSSGSESWTGTQLGGWLWLMVLAALAALVVAGLMALNIRAISQLTPTMAARVLVGAGIIGLLGLAVFFLQAQSATNDLGSLAALAGTASGISVGVGFGVYLAVLAMIAVLVGGVMQIRKPQMTM